LRRAIIWKTPYRRISNENFGCVAGKN